MAVSPLLVPKQYLLAGEMTKFPAESLVKKYEKLYDETKLSAKNVHFKASNTPTLPWESPSEVSFMEQEQKSWKNN